ncbi:MAG: hypothetical protein AAF423_02390 [Pseudomonadota bacterium]
MSSEENKKKTIPSTLPWLGRKLLWLDNMRNVDRIVYGLYGLCALLFLADFFYKKKTYLDLEDLPGFYGIYGFVMCAALVICARGMRIFLMRSEDYYSPKDVESEAYPEDGLERETNDD